MALAALSFLLAARLISTGGGSSQRRGLWTTAFLLLGVAATIGAFVHGLALTENVTALLWHGIDISLGLMIATFVAATAADVLGERAGRKLLLPLLIVAAGFISTTLFSADSFALFIIYESVALLLALTGYLWISLRGRSLGARWVAAGIIVTMIAAAAQTRDALIFELAWTFDHNGIFHLLQIVGLLLIFRGVAGPVAPLERSGHIGRSAAPAIGD